MKPPTTDLLSATGAAQTHSREAEPDQRSEGAASAGGSGAASRPRPAAGSATHGNDRRARRPPGVRAPAKAAAKKHVILFLAANPIGTDRLALDREARAIHTELKRSGYRDRFDFVTRWAAEPLDLLRELRELRPTVVHVSGHGGAGLPEAPGPAHNRDVVATSSGDMSGGLCFHSPGGGLQVVSPEAIAQAFSAAGASVKLVVLAACFTAPIAEALLAHVGCVIGMSSAIHDDAARSFAIGFYGGLGEHESIAAAFEQGRAAIHLEGLPDADRPALKVRDGVDATELILAAVSPSRRPDVSRHSESAPPSMADDRERSHGGGAELDDLVGRRRAGDEVDAPPATGEAWNEVETIHERSNTDPPREPGTKKGSTSSRRSATLVRAFLGILALFVWMIVMENPSPSSWWIGAQIAPETAPDTAPVLPPKAHRATVLWVDDHPENNIVERKLLASSGITFLLATSDAEVLGQAGAQSPDLIISDMRRASNLVAGYAFLDSLRQLKASIPVIIYSDSCLSERRAEATRLGAFGCTGNRTELIRYVLEALPANPST